MDLPFSVLLWHSDIGALLVMAHSLSQTNIPLRPTIKRLRFLPSALLARYAA
jgi:hypothetical protein